MSDTATTTEQVKGTGRNGQFLGEDLANLVTISPELQKMTGSQLLDDPELETLLANRIGGDSRRLARDIAEVIIDALPADLHSAEVMSAIDIRPYLQALDGKTIVARQAAHANPFDGEIAGAVMSEHASVRVAETADLLTEEDQRIRSEIQQQAAGTDLTPEKRLEIQSRLLDYTEGSAGITPLADPAAVAYAAGETATFNPATLASQMTNYGMPEEQLRATFNADQLTLDQLSDAEAQYAEANGGGMFGIDVARQPSPGTGHGRDHISNKRVGTVDALNYLQTLSPREIAKVQQRMAAGGYFDAIEGGAAFMEGDAHDPATKMAWRALITDSIRSNTPVPQILGGKMRTYRESVRQARLKAMQEIDPTYNNITADDYASQMIGRRLTTEEHAKLGMFMETLRTQRAGYVAGATDNESSTGVQGNTGVTDQDVGQWVRTTTEAEGQRDAMQQRLYTLSKQGA